MGSLDSGRPGGQTRRWARRLTHLRLSAARACLMAAASAAVAIGVFALGLTNSSARQANPALRPARALAAGARCTRPMRSHASRCARDSASRKRTSQRRESVERTAASRASGPHLVAREATHGGGRNASAGRRRIRSQDAVRRVGRAEPVGGAQSAGPNDTCFDRKASQPNGCWVPPAGYVNASKKHAAFKAIAVPSGESSEIPPGTINTEMQGPFSASDYAISNAWWNEAGGRFYDVYAGSMGSDPSQGVVVVFSGPLGDAQSSTAPSSLRAFPSPGQHGTLRITSAAGWILTLTASDGVKYRFDVKTSQYQAA
jgi:hypothetical protein